VLGFHHSEKNTQENQFKGRKIYFGLVSVYGQLVPLLLSWWQDRNKMVGMVWWVRASCLMVARKPRRGERGKEKRKEM
jgi:hypothetical protein